MIKDVIIPFEAEPPNRKTRSRTARWSVEPVPPYARGCGVAELLLMAGAARRRIIALETELRRLQNASQRSIR